MHYQTNYKSHDISKITNVNDLLRKELQRKKLNFYTTCSYCSCPFMDITSALKHQKKCVFQNTILRNDQSDCPQHEDRNEPAPEEEHEDIQEDEEEEDQEDQDREEENPNNPNRPTIVRATYTKKAYQDNIHEMSKECNDTDQDALSMRVNEVLMQFTANPNQAGNLISKFLAHFQMSQFKGKKGIQTDYQFKKSNRSVNRFPYVKGIIRQSDAGCRKI
ncbi:Hypothetical_protein [Hexamita inflata]|uniref:Hypothetical_protein n=1 Tax=Hexamita inflata TaxID=28002 RepID=A0AA86NXW0_9EUKA|nr:Hypothetical protein HINF_LOCUS15366 [Hexamita inflata]